MCIYTQNGQLASVFSEKDAENLSPDINGLLGSIKSLIEKSAQIARKITYDVKPKSK